MVGFSDLQAKKEKLAIVGLGYVGLPLGVLLARHFSVVGFDVNEGRIDELKRGEDHTGEVSFEDLKSVEIEYTSDPGDLKQAKFIIVAVPTPIDEDKKPDLFIVKKASETVGQNLSSGTVVVYESTVYPGVTDEICLSILEKESGLKAGVDFKVGYSPERVNPGDKEHTIDKIVKVVAGMDEESSELISKVYGTITQTYKATSIRVAEAAKVIENTQRDLNIALMNELAVIFNKMDISVYDVLAAAGTKWNFLNFKPGLVGGHCIGVDPYYLTYKAEECGYDPKVILAGRGINDSMHSFVAEQITGEMKKMGKELAESKVGIYGITFKENVPDIRNSKVAELYKELKEMGASPVVYDPVADKGHVMDEYGIELVDSFSGLDCLIMAVAHDEFKSMSVEDVKGLSNEGSMLLVDVKCIFDRDEIESQGIKYWCL